MIKTDKKIKKPLTRGLEFDIINKLSLRDGGEKSFLKNFQKPLDKPKEMCYTK